MASACSWISGASARASSTGVLSMVIVRPSPGPSVALTATRGKSPFLRSEVRASRGLAGEVRGVEVRDLPAGRRPDQHDRTAAQGLRTVLQVEGRHDRLVSQDLLDGVTMVGRHARDPLLAARVPSYRPMTQDEEGIAWAVSSWGRWPS